MVNNSLGWGWNKGIPFNNYRLKRPLGIGLYRSTWSVIGKQNTEIVIKIAHRFNEGEHNLIEWAIWNQAEEEVKKWLVPTLEMHDNGIWLVSKRVDPATTKPDRFPSWMSDANPIKNWGMMDGRHVLLDYGAKKMALALGITLTGE